MGTYHDGSRSLQGRFDTRRLADRLDERLVKERIEPDDRAFIEARDMFFLATADAEGRPQCSYKGGDPGFVKVIDDQTLVFPNYDGNGMFLSAGNAVVNTHVGLLFIDFEARSRLRVNGTAEHTDEDVLMSVFPGAQFVWRVKVTQVFPNCPRYIHEYKLVQRSRFVPKPDKAPPVPKWKTRPWASDVLASGDPATKPDAEIE